MKINGKSVDSDFCSKGESHSIDPVTKDTIIESHKAISKTLLQDPNELADEILSKKSPLGLEPLTPEERKDFFKKMSGADNTAKPPRTNIRTSEKRKIKF